MKIFVLTKKSGPFLDLFWSKIWPFCSKIRFLDIFFETARQICLKLGQKLGTIALNHRMAVLCRGKFLLVSRLQPLRPMDSRSSVRSSVRPSVRSSHSISRKPRIRFWWFFAQSYILMSLKNLPSGFWKNSRFQDFGQKWPFFAIFGHF